MVDVKYFMAALKVTWIRRITVSNKKYKAIFLINIPYIKNYLILTRKEKLNILKIYF